MAITANTVFFLNPITEENIFIKFHLYLVEKFNERYHTQPNQTDAPTPSRFPHYLDLISKLIAYFNAPEGNVLWAEIRHYLNTKATTTIQPFLHKSLFQGNRYVGLFEKLKAMDNTSMGNDLYDYFLMLGGIKNFYCPKKNYQFEFDEITKKIWPHIKEFAGHHVSHRKFIHLKNPFIVIHHYLAEETSKFHLFDTSHRKVASFKDILFNLTDLFNQPFANNELFCRAVHLFLCRAHEHIRENFSNKLPRVNLLDEKPYYRILFQQIFDIDNYKTLFADLLVYKKFIDGEKIIDFDLNHDAKQKFENLRLQILSEGYLSALPPSLKIAMSATN